MRTDVHISDAQGGIRLASTHAKLPQVTEFTERPTRDYPTQRQASYREIVGDALTIEAIAKIRHCGNTGLALGTETFRRQVETMKT